MKLITQPTGHRSRRPGSPCRTLSLLAGLALLGASTAWSFQSTGAVGSPPVGAADPGRTDRLIIKFRDAQAGSVADPGERAGVQVAGNRAGVRLTRLRASGQTGGHVMKLDRPLASAEWRRLAEDIRSGDSAVEYVEPDLILQAQWIPNDPSFGSQWHYTAAAAGINLPTAWDLSRGANVVVGVIDTGVLSHADLAGQILPGYDFINSASMSNDGDGRDADARDPGDWTTVDLCGTGTQARNSSWHGTHVAGTIAAATNNGVGVAGVAPASRVLPLRVLGRCGGYTSDIADAIIWGSGGAVSGLPANLTPAKVLNLSLGGAGPCGATTQNAINSARSRGTVVVVAAGNATSDAANFTPANCAGVITVAAVGPTGARASYSNYGAVVDVAAPGGDAAAGILSTLNAGATTPGADVYRTYIGTSMATPHVAGVAALMLARNPALTPDQVEAALKSSAAARGFPVACSQCGSGIVDARRAVEAVGGTPTPAPIGAPVPTPTPVPSVTRVDEVEPNDTRPTAQRVTVFPAIVQATVGALTDADYFRVDLPAGKTLTATLTPNVSSDYDLRGYAASGELLAMSNYGTGKVDQISMRNASAATQTFFVRVLRYSGLVGAAGTYTLKLAQ